MENKKVETTDIASQYHQVCEEYEMLIKKAPAGMNAEQIKKHFEKCKAIAGKKNQLAEQFFKLPISRRCPKKDEVKK